ncbi:transcription factor bHLH93 [Arachis ipaensis]|uniref:transcription factor bHLH93 n=1 Tax=Arachis ipaensis TaxID=130454 RepID=UPI0007AF0282|nr:transcription factor bHLH93 [Arachis ipaensis]
MELSQLGFLEELLLLAPRRVEETCWNNGFNDLLPTTPPPSASVSASWSFDSLDDNPSLNPSFSSFSTPLDHRFDSSYAASFPFLDAFTIPPELHHSPPPLLPQQEHNNNNNNHPLVEEEEEELGFLGNDDNNQSLEERNSGRCKVEEQQALEVPAVVFNMGMCGEKKVPKSKKLEGQPSKNLMAERRRRKRLNDRLSMLRSIVPKISKMDRTSILGDTIDYMKELLERIAKLQEETMEEEGKNQIHLLGISKELKPNEVMFRNSPKFDVERRDHDTRISICCATKPGLLLSTVNTLEALGLEIHQCVISGFNDFSMQASCSEVAEERNCISTEDVKQALFKNAGYGGRCV